MIHIHLYFTVSSQLTDLTPWVIGLSQCLWGLSNNLLHIFIYENKQSMVWYCLLERNKGVFVPPKKREEISKTLRVFYTHSSTSKSRRVHQPSLRWVTWGWQRWSWELLCSGSIRQNWSPCFPPWAPSLKGFFSESGGGSGKETVPILHDQTFKIFLWYFCPSDCRITGRWTLNLTKLIINSKNRKNTSASHSKQNCKQLGYLYDKPPGHL